MLVIPHQQRNKMNLVGVLLSVIAILNVEEKTYSAAYRTQRRIKKHVLLYTVLLITWFGLKLRVRPQNP